MRLFSGCLMKLPAEGKVKRFPGAAAVPALSSTHSLILVQPNVLPRLSVTLWWQNIKRYSYSFLFCFHKKKEKGSISVPRSEKWAWRADKVFYLFIFFVTVGLGVYPSPLSVAKLHPRMSYHRHICRKYAMKLCGSFTIGPSAPPPPPPPPPPPTFIAFLSAVCRGSMSVGQLHPVGRLSLSFFFFFFLLVFHIHASSSQRAPGHRGPRL